MALPACRAARAGALAGDAVGDVLHLRVVELERLRAHRLERGDLLLGLELDLLLGVQLVLGRDQDHVARLAQAQVLRLQDDVERLVPGHVLQAQGDVAGDGVAGHDVEVGEVGDDLQQRADFDVLEVERQLLARVAGALDSLFGSTFWAAPRARTGCRSGRRCVPTHRAGRRSCARGRPAGSS